MKKLKVYIFAYAKNNLGDDIFLKILVEKYPDINFYINIEQEKYMTLLHKYPNVTIIKAKTKILIKLIQVLMMRLLYWRLDLYLKTHLPLKELKNLKNLF